MKDWILFAISTPFMAAGIVWELIVRGFRVGREFMALLINE